MIGFFTPKLPDPLNLDLAALDGGGSSPSQFYGETHEGRDVYVRYRGGWLMVYVARWYGDDPLRDGDCVLEANIGPPYDGSISLAQFCRLFGVTINGAAPDETDPEACRNVDFTGATTYWRGGPDYVTEPTSRRILAACHGRFEGALLVQPRLTEEFALDRLIEISPDNVDQHFVWLTFGAGAVADLPIHPEEYLIERSGQLHIEISYNLWRWRNIPYEGPNAGEAARELGRPVIIPTTKDDLMNEALPHRGMWFRAEFPTDDADSRDRLAAIGEAVSQFVPKTSLERIDLESGETVSRLVRRLDPIIVDWINASEDRWMTVLRERGRWIGVRPAPG